LPAGAPSTLAQALERAASSHPNHGIFYPQPDGPEGAQTYPELLLAAERLLAGLRRLGLEPGDKVLFQLARLEDFVTAFWASMLGGFVPVPLSIAPTYEQPNTALDKLANAWHMLDRPWVLCDREILPSVRSLSGLLGLPGLRAEAVDALRRHPPDPRHHACAEDDLALLLLTSGSTGRPKAVMQTHRALLTRSAAVARHNDFTPQDVSLNWMPLDHVGGIVMFHLRDVYVGCRQIQAPTAAILEDPLRWLDWIERFRATITWAPNFAFALVNDRADQIDRRRWDLSSMRFILNGGEAIVARTARTFLRLLEPHALQPTAMKPAWGMSETCSGITYSHDFTLASTSDEDPFVEVGVPVPGAAVRIVDAQHRVVAEGTVGRLEVKGPMITAGYYQAPELDALAFTADRWFDTGDLGLLVNGRLSITGREKDLLIVHGINYYCHEIEAVVEEVQGVESSYTAACPVREAGSDTDELAIFFHTPWEDWDRRIQLIRDIRSRVTARTGLNPAHVIPMARHDIPKTAIGKIQRARLRQQLEAGDLRDLLKRIDLLTGSPRTLPAWFYRRVWRPKLVPEAAGAIGAGLVLADAAGLGSELCRRLRRPDRTWVHVEPGTGFARLARDRYQTVPGDRDQHRRLLRSLAADGIAIGHVVHLGTYGEPCGITGLADLEKAQERGLYDLLHLIQALAEAHRQPAHGEPPTRLSLLVVASRAQAVDADDPVAADRAALLGLVETVPQEMTWIDCRHLDLPPDDPGRNVSRVERELAALDGDREVAWRRG
ncbi:MAG: AMP-binding protein, partial [Acidobacteriota bacterium]|nr:AMP-binding protein [Acidobacteriota bacterium]